MLYFECVFTCNGDTVASGNLGFLPRIGDKISFFAKSRTYVVQSIVYDLNDNTGLIPVQIDMT